MKNLKRMICLFASIFLFSGCPKTKIVDESNFDKELYKTMSDLDDFSKLNKDNFELQIGITNLYMNFGLTLINKDRTEEANDLNKIILRQFNILNELEPNNEKIAVLKTKWLFNEYWSKTKLPDYLLVRIKDIREVAYDKLVIPPSDSLYPLFQEDLIFITKKEENKVITDFNQAEYFLNSLVKKEAEKTIELIKKYEKVNPDNAYFNSILEKIYNSIKDSETANIQKDIKVNKKEENYLSYFNNLSLKVLKDLGLSRKNLKIAEERLNPLKE